MVRRLRLKPARLYCLAGFLLLFAGNPQSPGEQASRDEQVGRPINVIVIKMRGQAVHHRLGSFTKKNRPEKATGNVGILTQMQRISGKREEEGNDDNGEAEYHRPVPHLEIVN